MAIIRTVLPRKGLVQPQHGLTGYEQDMDGNMSMLDANVAFMSDLVQSQNALAATFLAGPPTGIGVPPTMRAIQLSDLPLGAIQAASVLGLSGCNGILNGLQLSTSSSLVPGLTGGNASLSGSIVGFGSPIAPAAPASATNYLFAHLGIGGLVAYYYQSLPVSLYYTTYGSQTIYNDALLGKVVTSGTAVTAVTPAAVLFSQISVSPAGAGNFTVQHYLGRPPIGAIIRPTSSANIYWQSPTDVDGTNLYLTASGAGTAKILIF